jgi:hypothetical protein
MAEDTLVVTGYKEFIRACDHAGKETKKQVRDTFRKVGDIVKVDAAAKFAAYDVRSAAGYRTVVRQRGVSVEQSLRRTTGLHPDYGALQMRKALLPALSEDEPRIEHEFELALDKVADHFDGI